MVTKDPAIISQLHLLGRAAAQVMVFFGARGYEPAIRLDITCPRGINLGVFLPFTPEPGELHAFLALHWMQHFNYEEQHSHPRSHAFTLTTLQL